MMNENVANSLPRLPLWRRILLTLGAGVVTLVALMFYPPAYESARLLLARPISSAMASDANAVISPSSARRQQVSDAHPVVHGSYLKDPYDCVYMVEYVGAKLSVSPVLNERQEAVCGNR